MLLNSRLFEMGAEHDIDPKSRFLHGLAEGEGVVAEPVVEKPPEKEPEPKPGPLEPAAEGDDDDGGNDIETLLDGLSRRLEATIDNKVEARRAAGDERPEKTLRELVESEDESVLKLVGAIEKLSEKVSALEAHRTQTDAEKVAAAEQEYEQQYALGVTKFAERYAGFTDKELESVGAYHVRLIQRDERSTALSFDEVARRMYGDDGLEARRTKGDAPVREGRPAPNGRTSQPSGSPIPARSTGGGPPKKFEPGPGKGVGDVTERLKAAGAFRAVISER